MNKFLVVTTSFFSRVAVQGLALRGGEGFDKLAKQADANRVGIK